MSSTIRQSTKLITLVIVISMLVSFNTEKAYSAGQYAPKTKTPTPTLTRTNTPSPTVTNTATPTGTAFACTTWNIANDFRISPNQENPNRDSCNNLGVWEFMGSSSLTRDPGTYYRVTTFSPAAGGYAGLDFWLGNYTDSNGSFPDIGFNGSGSDILIAGHINLPANALDIHPAPNQLGIVAWHSPVTGYVSIMGGVGDNDGACGDGIFWYLEKNSANLAYGAIGNGGSQVFSAGTGGMGLNTVSVSAGDVIYLAIHPNGNYICDNTRVDLVISVTSPPTATATHTATPSPTATFTETPKITLTPSDTPTPMTYTPIAGTPQGNGSGPCWISKASWETYTVFYDITMSPIPGNITPAEWLLAIDASAQTWNNVTPSQFTLIRQSGGLNIVSYQETSNPKYLAEAAGSPSSGYITGTYIRINPGYLWDVNNTPAQGTPGNNGSTVTYNLQNVVTHEFGHWLFLDDIYDPNCSQVTMDHDAAHGELIKIDLDAADIAGVNWKYP